MFLEKIKTKLFNVNLFLNINKYNFLNDLNILKFKKDLSLLNTVLENNIFDELIDTILILLFYRDPQIFIKWFKYNMQLIFFKKHNTFINLIENILNTIYTKYGVLKNFLGYKLIIKGKLNKIGNVRKKKIIISKGKNTLTNINFKSDYLSSSIPTITGTIGIKIIINYL